MAESDDGRTAHGVGAVVIGLVPRTTVPAEPPPMITRPRRHLFGRSLHVMLPFLCDWSTFSSLFFEGICFLGVLFLHFFSCRVLVIKRTMYSYVIGRRPDWAS